MLLILGNLTTYTIRLLPYLLLSWNYSSKGLYFLIVESAKSFYILILLDLVSLDEIGLFYSYLVIFF